MPKSQFISTRSRGMHHRRVQSMTDPVPWDTRAFGYWEARSRFVKAMAFRMPPETGDYEYRRHHSDFYKESEQTYAFSPSFMEWLKRFLALPYDEATKMYDFVTAGLSPFFTDSAIRMSNTYENVILKLDTTAYRMYVNLKEDKYSTTNAMFAVFFDNILDRHLFFNSFDEQMNRRIYPYKHYILDDIDLIPLSPRVKKNLPRVDRLGVTTTILASHAADVKSYLSLTDKVLLMGGNTDEKDIKYLSERFKVDADTISEYAVYDNALFFEDGKDMLILNKLGSRGVF